jgi:hypothetical protein
MEEKDAIDLVTVRREAIDKLEKSLHSQALVGVLR